VEQHRVLLIIVSVAVVLAAIIGGGIWLLYPRDGGEGGLAADLGRAGDGQSTGFEWEPIDYLQGGGASPGLEQSSTSDEDSDVFTQTYGTVSDDSEIAVEPLSGTTQGVGGTTATSQSRPDRIVTVREETSQSSSGGAAVAGAGPGSGGSAASSPSTSSTASETGTTSSGSSTTTPAPASSEGDAARASSAAPAAGSPGGGPAAGAAATRSTASGSTASSAGSTTSGSSSVATTASAGAGASVPLADRAYWVQVISSPHRDTAEQAQQTLRDHQLGSRVVTRDISGTTYYRVRLGPFAVRAEAEKFLGWVVEIDDFADSMIFVDYTTAVAAASSGS